MNLNTEYALLPSQARTATTNSDNQTNNKAKGVVLFINVTALTGTPSIRPYIFAIDPVSGGAFSLWQAPATITATGQYSYVVYPGATGGNATATAGIPIPRTWKLNIGHGTTDSITYSAAISYII